MPPVASSWRKACGTTAAHPSITLSSALRFVHIDASHMFEPTIHELKLARYVLSDDGVICLDDFTNLNYSQILAALFKFLFSSWTDLEIFIVTSEKVFLCRKGAFETYGSFVLGQLPAELKARDVGQPCVARTDVSRWYRAFHVRPKNPGESDDFYGQELYHKFYQAP